MSRLYELRSHHAERDEKDRHTGRSLASPARFERAAFRLGGECSILLSYGDTNGNIDMIPRPKKTVKKRNHSGNACIETNKQSACNQSEKSCDP